ncbi:hypothetical protein CERSUDRAFT_162391 [Gelatoporia subvermispora B]|uniref:Uncharacterized protein n=1 Tax=Ceriporiopsis subvermispora (strain B) TaxID=914234 RepID=M2R131_CERS8|nr:hypothetical protein CERSUDRAFT_162391 [Gelatoporia subvermispora B]
MESTSVSENSFYVANYLSAILYGIELALYFATVHAASSLPKRERSDAIWVYYSTVLLVLLTIDISTNAVWGQQMWITFRDRPGGVPAFIATEQSVWYETLGTTSAIALICLGDALLIYRCYIIWASRLSIIAVPILVYLGDLDEPVLATMPNGCSPTGRKALGILVLVSSGTPGGKFFSGKAVDFGTPFYCMAISLNIILTMLICGRLLYISRWARKTLGHDPSTLYTGLMSIMIESALPYSICGIMFIIPYVRGSDTSIAFAQMWGKFTCISPQLIVFRVVTRKAWNGDTHTQALSAMQFNTGSITTNHTPDDPTPLTDLTPYADRTAVTARSKTWKEDNSLKSIA